MCAFIRIHLQGLSCRWILAQDYTTSNSSSRKHYCEIIIVFKKIAAKYFAMIGEYELADSVTDKGLELCNDEKRRVFLFYSPENMISRLKKQKEDTNRYRTKKPYWPATEERRRAVAMFYDEKGIKYPRIENRPEKITESKFAPINECFDDDLTDYCAFWCADTFSLSAAKGIYATIILCKVFNRIIVFFGKISKLMISVSTAISTTFEIFVDEAKIFDIFILPLGR